MRIWHWILVVSICAVIGTCAAHQYWYYREAREARRLATAIDGVKVLEVDGNHDTTLESIWLDMEYRGERLYFGNVTPASFSDVPHLGVAQIGPWVFTVRGYVAGKEPVEEHCRSVGGGLDFGSEGDVGARLEPPIRSIPEFLRRLPEMRRIVATLPDEPPGERIGTDEHRVIVTATGELKTTPLWVWAYRERARQDE